MYLNGNIIKIEKMREKRRQRVIERMRNAKRTVSVHCEYRQETTVSTVLFIGKLNRENTLLDEQSCVTKT